jgi:hypothetical protein
MKLRNLLSAICLLTVFVFSGCTKNSASEPLSTKDSQVELQLSTVNEKGEILNTETISKSKRNVSRNLETRSNPNQIATGDFTQANGITTMDLSAVLNEGGVNGDLYWHSVQVGLVHAETIGVSTNSAGEAVTAFHILSVENPNLFYKVNAIFFIKVKDNGEGAKSNRDQHSSLGLVFTNWFLFYNTPEDFIQDNPCSDYFNHTAFATMLNITEGQIQVW